MGDFGIWEDRTDIEDSAAYAREQREIAWKRVESSVFSTVTY